MTCCGEITVTELITSGPNCLATVTAWSSVTASGAVPVSRILPLTEDAEAGMREAAGDFRRQHRGVVDHLDVEDADQLLAFAIGGDAGGAALRPRIESDRSVSGLTSAISGSPTVTSVKLGSVRTSADLPWRHVTVAVRLAPEISTSFCAARMRRRAACRWRARRKLPREQSESRRLPAILSVCSRDSPPPLFNVPASSRRDPYRTPPLARLVGAFHRHAVFLFRRRHA